MTPFDETEGSLMARVRLRLANAGTVLFRNDNGKARRLHDPSKIFTYGLGTGTHDLIGWRPVEITQEMVGTVLAQFVSVEMKRGEDRLSKKQAKFGSAVQGAGGLFIVAETPEGVHEQVVSRLV